jgi:hypothetical protein
MKLEVHVDSRRLVLDIPEAMLDEATEFFHKMDHDMDGGRRMGPEFIERPDLTQRCQIAADRLLGSLSSVNQTMVLLMGAYIAKRLPGVRGVRIDTQGEPLQTEFIYGAGETRAPRPASTPARVLNKVEAMEQAGREVAQVYRVGKSYRFATLDGASGQWLESPLFENEREAHDRRMQAVKQRFDALTGAPVAEARPGGTR